MFFINYSSKLNVKLSSLLILKLLQKKIEKRKSLSISKDWDRLKGEKWGFFSSDFSWKIWFRDSGILARTPPLKRGPGLYFWGLKSGRVGGGFENLETKGPLFQVWPPNLSRGGWTLLDSKSTIFQNIFIYVVMSTKYNFDFYMRMIRYFLTVVSMSRI